MADKQKEFLKALEGKRISPLTLDNKWHQLFDGAEIPAEIRAKADELNELLKQQGNINNELKKVKGLKKKLLDEMVTLADDAASGVPNAEKELEQHKRLIEDCNGHIDDYQDQLLDFPKLIDHVNRDLMIMTMDDCYDRLKENNKEIEEIGKWIDEFRRELKKNVVRKQDRELANHRLYSYMHDIFGTEVIEIFDMQYIPTGLKAPGSTAKENSDSNEKKNES
ncbi:MAG: hypothetical protein K5673_10795 [Lachnospiraceae bacterium]|nr:hypothetical protein [Lachnospiraceae bacterium]